jgi:hypothetical protein
MWYLWYTAKLALRHAFLQVLLLTLPINLQRSYLTSNPDPPELNQTFY